VATNVHARARLRNYSRKGEQERQKAGALQNASLNSPVMRRSSAAPGTWHGVQRGSGTCPRTSNPLLLFRFLFEEKTRAILERIYQNGRTKELDDFTFEPEQNGHENDAFNPEDPWTHPISTDEGQSNSLISWKRKARNNLTSIMMKKYCK
jgi:hypothetical protein